LLEDAQLHLPIVNALRLSLEFSDLIREGYSQDSFYGDEGEWTKDSRIEAIAGYFWHLYRMCVPRNSELRLRLIAELHNSSSGGHIGVDGTFAKSLDRFRWKRIRQDVQDSCERCVVCRRAKIQPQMAATLCPIFVPPSDSNGPFSALRKERNKRKVLICLFRESTDYTDCPECWLVIVTRNSPMAFDIRFGDALERNSKFLSIDTMRRMD
jgi:hypothetical protein